MHDKLDILLIIVNFALGIANFIIFLNIFNTGSFVIGVFSMLIAYMIYNDNIRTL